MRRATLLAVCVLLAGPAVADGDLRPAPADLERLERFDAHLGGALRQALAGGSPADIAALTTALAGTPVWEDFTGDWTCRTMKLGGLLPLTVYSPFRCRITELPSGEWRFEKLTGSQLTAGTIYPFDGELRYLGVGHIAGAAPIGYEAYHAGDIPAEAGQVTADVGILEVTGPNRARLMLPAPMLESDFDILELTR